MFNPNELVLERIRSVEEYDPASGQLIGRYTQIESPSLKTAAEGTAVTDAMGSEITTFYKAQTGTFDFTNSLHSLDLMASQFGSKKEVANDANKIMVPVTETIALSADAKAVLSAEPAGPISSVKLINENNEFGETYVLSAETAPSAGKFTLDAAARTIELPAGTTGRIFVTYEKESAAAVKMSKNNDSVPEVRSLLIHAIFHNPCDVNKVYAGVISVPRAQIDPSAVELTLTPDGKHSASYKLQNAYCDKDAKLFDIIVSED